MQNIPPKAILVLNLIVGRNFVGFEDYVRAKQAEVTVEKIQREKLEAAVDKAENIFALVGGDKDASGYKEVTTDPVLSEQGVYMFLKQVPHNDRSGVNRYDLVFEVENRKFIYASIRRGADRIGYSDASVHENGYDPQTDEEMLGLLDLIREEELS
ncbi:hypothetical protein KW794_03110 [Candidatus Saccharibacteria bacterium]|nr:hypothetical protein [Candidatus Saccharibacteria bacterium]